MNSPRSHSNDLSREGLRRLFFQKGVMQHFRNGLGNTYHVPLPSAPFRLVSEALFGEEQSTRIEHDIVVFTMQGLRLANEAWVYVQGQVCVDEEWGDPMVVIEPVRVPGSDRNRIALFPEER